MFLAVSRFGYFHLKTLSLPPRLKRWQPQSIITPFILHPGTMPLNRLQLSGAAKRIRSAQQYLSPSLLSLHLSFSFLCSLGSRVCFSPSYFAACCCRRESGTFCCTNALFAFRHIQNNLAFAPVPLHNLLQHSTQSKQITIHFLSQ